MKEIYHRIDNSEITSNAEFNTRILTCYIVFLSLHKSASKHVLLDDIKIKRIATIAASQNENRP
jgi:hypothetical protein